jgi:hypothetical protein
MNRRTIISSLTLGLRAAGYENATLVVDPWREDPMTGSPLGVVERKRFAMLDVNLESGVVFPEVTLYVLSRELTG